MANTPEGKVKDKVKKLLKSLGPRCWWYMPVQNGMGVVGIPDFVGCLDGRFFGIETKAPGKKNNLTVNQQLQLAGIESARGQTFVVAGDDDITALAVFFRITT
jgi:hypothetical protein